MTGPAQSQARRDRSVPAGVTIDNGYSCVER